MQSTCWLSQSTASVPASRWTKHATLRSQIEFLSARRRPAFVSYYIRHNTYGARPLPPPVHRADAISISIVGGVTFACSLRIGMAYTVWRWTWLLQNATGALTVISRQVTAPVVVHHVVYIRGGSKRHARQYQSHAGEYIFRIYLCFIVSACPRAELFPFAVARHSRARAADHPHLCYRTCRLSVFTHLSIQRLPLGCIYGMGVNPSPI